MAVMPAQKLCPERRSGDRCAAVSIRLSPGPRRYATICAKRLDQMAAPGRMTFPSRSMRTLCAAVVVTCASLAAVTAFAADYPAPKQGDWIAKDFKFHTGHVMPELKLHYTTVGEPSGQPVLVLHGTGGSALSMLTPA